MIDQQPSDAAVEVAYQILGGEILRSRCREALAAAYAADRLAPCKAGVVFEREAGAPLKPVANPNEMTPEEKRRFEQEIGGARCQSDNT